MGRKVALFLLLAFVPNLAFGWGAGSSSSTATVSQTAESSLTFWAPLNDPDNPLTLYKGTGSLSFTRATTATYTAIDNGFISVAADNVLRIESNGALIEGARTNIALQSEVLGTTWAASNVTLVNDNAVAPDGASTAERLTASAGNGTLLQSVTGTATAYTFSIYLKRLTGTGNVDVRADNTTWATCPISTSAWTRCSATATLTDNTYSPGVRIVASGDAVYAWGGQMEAGIIKSSYIPTTVSEVARNADQLTAQISGNLATGYTVYAEGGATGNSDGGVWRIIVGHNWPEFGLAGIQPGGPNDYFSVLGGATPNIGVYTGGNSKFAARLSDAIPAQDGTLYAAGPVPTLSAAEIGIGSASGTTQYWYGHVKNVRIWGRALTDAEMVAITQ